VIKLIKKICEWKGFAVSECRRYNKFEIASPALGGIAMTPGGDLTNGMEKG
jgi:hypothetical protein